MALMLSVGARRSEEAGNMQAAANQGFRKAMIYSPDALEARLIYRSNRRS
jgi:hypothetical protein